AVDAGIGIANHVPGMAGDAHALLVGLVGDHLEHLGLEELRNLDGLVAVLLLLLHDRARGRLVRHLHVAAPGARALGLELALACAHRLPGRPEPRAADQPFLGAFLLGEAPGAVLLGLDLHAGRDAEMQVDLAPERFPMAVAVDEARQHGLAADVDDLGARRHLHLAGAADRPEAAVLDHDDRVLDRGAAGAVDQGPALDHERLRGWGGCGQCGRADQDRERFSDHMLPFGPLLAGLALFPAPYHGAEEAPQPATLLPFDVASVFVDRIAAGNRARTFCVAPKIATFECSVHP